MEEIEVPLESVQEELHHKAEHSQETWIARVALSSAILAVCAAIAALLAGHYSNEAMIEQIQASDHWSYYQAKGIKAAILSSRIELLQNFAKNVSQEQKNKLEEYKKDQEEISNLAKEKEAESQYHLRLHQTLAKAVTFFQVAIAIAAISVLMKRRRYWYLSLALGLAGIFFFIKAFIS